MKPRQYSSEGIVLAKINYSEADRIVVIFSKDHGKLPFIAKSVRKIKSRKRGVLEVFNRITFSAIRGKGMDYIEEVEIVNSFPKIRQSLKKISLAYYFVEIAGRAIHEGEANLNLYEVIITYLEKLESTTRLKELKAAYLYEVLVVLGFWPRGKKLSNPEEYIESVLERRIFSERVGKRIFEKSFD